MKFMLKFPRVILHRNPWLLSHTEMVIRAMEVKVNIDSIYLVFQKAFNKANHNVIINTCWEKGIYGLLGKWIANYLHNITQRVISNKKESPKLTVLSGVAQGLVLGPFLFFILIDSILIYKSHLPLVYILIIPD